MDLMTGLHCEDAEEWSYVARTQRHKIGEH